LIGQRLNFDGRLVRFERLHDLPDAGANRRQMLATASAHK
jgi:hypothetical protein